jgi:hypothetical protein
MSYRAVSSAVVSFVLSLSLLPLVGCDKAAPEAPDGSILAISANPTRIALNGQSIITIIGRQPDGNPLNPGTEIRLSATLGSITSIVTTDRTGTATATFQSNGVLGTATIMAATGSGGSGGTTTTSDTGSSSGVSSASVNVQVGTIAGTIILQPTPTSLPATGGKVRLLAIVRDANGVPLANQGVNFTTDYGTLNSRGGTVTTDASGQARDTLTLSSVDLASNVASVMVTVQTVGGGAMGGTALLSAMTTIHIQTNKPTASFTYQLGSTANSVQFTDTSTSTGTLTFSWNFGDGGSATESSPMHTYSSPGTYNVVETVTDASSGLSDTATAQVVVPVTAPGTGN